jgi:hypothetical protein
VRSSARLLASIAAAATLSAAASASASAATLPGPAGTAAAPCAFPPSRTILRFHTGRLFRPARGGQFGCLYRYGKAVRYAGAETGNLHVSDPYLAYSIPGASYPARSVHGGCVASFVVVYDLRPSPPGPRFHRVHAAPSTGSDAPPPDPSTPCTTPDPVTDLVVAGNSAVAWIVRPDPAVKDYRVMRVSANAGLQATPKVLASGAGIAPTSLRPDGKRVTWVQDGTRRSAALK